MKSNSNNHDIESSDIKDIKLNEVLNANKNLYDKLNKIPEIEAIQSIEVEEEIISEISSHLLVVRKLWKHLILILVSQ